MGMKKKILDIVLSFLSIFLCFFSKKKQRVTFISLTADRLQGNFKLLADELKKDEHIEVYTILTKYEKNLMGNFRYFLNCIKQFFIINTSKVVVLNDNNYVVSNFKKPFPTVIQLWHASGAIKKFGNEIQREYEIKNYDYVISTSDAWKFVYSKSFHIPQECVVPLGIPCTDALFQKTSLAHRKQAFYDAYPYLKDKYIILYAPTFRGNIIKGMYHVELDLDNIMRHVPDDYVILYKLHPLLENVSLGCDDRVMNVKNEDLYRLLAVSDCLISDYSSIIFDYLLLEKKQIYYIPDVDEYRKTIGLNIAFENLPGPICKNEDELIASLVDEQAFSLEALKACKDVYFTHKDGKSTKRIVQFISGIIEERGDAS